MKYIKQGITGFALLALVSACTQNKLPKEILGYTPIYADPQEVAIIKNESPRLIKNAGKIYQYLDYTFQVEIGEGIHIINSEDAKNPQKIGFIRVLGCSEISIQNDRLYTNNMRDLVSLDISDVTQVKPVSRIEKIFPGVNQETPPVTGVYFECVDPSLGTVIGWKEEILNNPKCKN